MPASLRVLVVSDVSPLMVSSGGERVLWEQASRLAAVGHQVRILSRSPSDGARGTVEREGVQIRHFPVDRRSLLGFVRSSILEARRAVVQVLAEADADVLHVFQPLSGYGVLRSPAGRRIPSLYSFLSPAPLEYRARRGTTGLHRGGWSGSLGTGLLWLIEGACLRRATRIHVLSDYSARLLWKLYRVPSRRIVKISGGVDTRWFRPAEDREATRRALGLPQGSVLLFTLRDLEPRMGLDALIRAIALVRQDLPVRLVIGGRGVLRAELEALANTLGLTGVVSFAGLIPEADLPSYYQAADLFVLPTRALEGFGLVTVEALACGTPVLGTPVGATPEILGSLAPEFLTDDASPEALARGVRRVVPLLGDAGFRTRCREHAESHYAWQAAAARLEEVLEELAAERLTS